MEVKNTSSTLYGGGTQKGFYFFRNGVTDKTLPEKSLFHFNAHFLKAKPDVSNFSKECINGIITLIGSFQI